MGWLFLAAFIGIPILEIAVFIKIGGIIGLVPTLISVVLTAVVGTALLRHQGLATLNQARHQMDRGTLPLAEIFHAACLLVAGALLLTPGFVTDGFGALLLIPGIRNALRRLLSDRIQISGVHGATSGRGGFRPDDDYIDVDYDDITEVRDEPGLDTLINRDPTTSAKPR